MHCANLLIYSLRRQWRKENLHCPWLIIKQSLALYFGILNRFIYAENGCKAMRILVLGGNGFIGVNLVDRLINSGHKVCVYDRSHPRFPTNLPSLRATSGPPRCLHSQCQGHVAPTSSKCPRSVFCKSGIQTFRIAPWTCRIAYKRTARH